MTPLSEIRISQLIAEPFHAVHRFVRDSTYNEIWLKGGRGSTKSSSISLEIIQGVVRDIEANAIVYRKVDNTLRDSVYAQMVWAINMLELRPWFKCKVSPMEIIYKPTGQRILFRGADDPGKSKSIKLDKGYFKYLWFEELTEFHGMDDIRTIKASILRGGGRALTFASYNPPKSANNWVNAECLVPVPGRLVHHSDYTQVPPEWLGPAFLADAEALKTTNENAYRHIYLGEVTGTGGQVFDNLEIRAITTDEINALERAYHGLDFGFAIDPDAYVKMGFRKMGRELFIHGECGDVRMGLDKLAKSVKQHAGADRVVCDSAAPREIHELRLRGINAAPAYKPPGSVDTTMRWLQELGKIVIDPALCPNAAREFAGYEYPMDKQGRFRSDYPDKDNHWIDAARYGSQGMRESGLGFVSAARPAQTDRAFRR